MTLGPSSAPSQSPPIALTTPSFDSPNHFELLSLAPSAPECPEYSPLAYVDVEIKTSESKEGIATRALVDCGGQGSFINDKLSQRYQLPSLPKLHPVSLILADGSQSTAGHVTHFNPLLLHTAGNDEPISLDVAPTSHDVILGMPWLEKHDPAVRFGQRTLTFDSPYCQQNCDHYGKALPLHTSSLPSKGSPLGEEEKDKRDESRTVLPPRDLSAISRTKVQRNDSLVLKTVDNTAPHTLPVLPSVKASPPSRKTTPTKPSAKASTRTKLGRLARAPRTAKAVPKVSLVGAQAFAHLCNQPGVQLFTMSFADLGVELSSTQTDANPGDPDLSQIPSEYHEYADLFSEQEALKLPPHRPYDHQIPLEEGATPPFGTIYPMSLTELDTLRKYVEENLHKGFIRHSQSPCGAPVLFVKKPDGSLRLCVDYRGLNKITTKNRYPLPLIGELLDRISRAKYFTKFDVRDGYNRLRMASGEEWKTAFRCRYGLFEYTVMPFGLCNAPGTFQHYMNDTFRDFLDKFLIIYLDDLLIYSDNLAEHKKHVRAVLDRLREAGLCLKPSKCQFHVQEVSFLGFIVGADGIKMDPAKVAAITGWPQPKSVHDIRVFLGLANFYRRFVKDFSNIVTPITALLKKDCKFVWGEKAQAALEELKAAFTTDPVLHHFDPLLPVILEADASDFALGAVISQRDPVTGALHPITFHSRKFNTAELNYEIYDKEMLAIVETLLHYRHYFEGLGNRTTVYSDHRNLLWFTETKLYNRRQARWAEKLAQFDFLIIFRPGTQGGKPDALSRRPDYTLGDDKEERTMTFLKPEQVDTTLIDSDSATLAAYSLNANAVRELVGTNEDLARAIVDALPTDPGVGPYLHHLRDPEVHRADDVAEYLRPFSLDQNGLLLHDGLVYVPAVDSIKADILKGCHDDKTAGHLGQQKTLELVSRDYYWPRMRQFVNEYIRTCDVCARNKMPRHTPHGQLHPLPIPEGPWHSVSMDFIVELPPSEGYDAIYVCVDRFTKMARFCPTNSNVTAEQSAQLYLRNVFKDHGLPVDIVSDRGQQFTSRFTRRLLELCEIKGNRSTAYHPQSDGQTERVNQTLEQYLRVYCDFQQDDWYQLLPLAEFVYNNASHASTKVSPFFANYGYNPRATLKIALPADSVNPSAEEFANRMRTVHTTLRGQLKAAQATYKENFDKRAKAPPPFVVGDQVWLIRRNIKTVRPSQKLDVKKMGPFKILKIVGESQLAFKLELPPQMRIHPVFHVSLLEPYRANTIEGRTQPPPPPPDEIAGELEYEVKEILDSKFVRQKLHYYVDWVGYTPDERTWEPAEYVEHATDAVASFHQQHPNRPAPGDAPPLARRRGRGRRG